MTRHWTKDEDDMLGISIRCDEVDLLVDRLPHRTIDACRRRAGQLRLGWPKERRYVERRVDTRPKMDERTARAFNAFLGKPRC